MKSKLFLTVLLLAAIATIGISQEKKTSTVAEKERVSKLPLRVQSLYGVKGIYVVVWELSENAKASGLTKEQLKTDVELKLRLAGIKVNTEEEFQASNGHPYLYVNINTVIDEYLFSLSTDLQFRQDVRLQRNPDLLIHDVTTWETGNVGSVGKSRFKEVVRNALKDLTDEFINAYLTANPKK